jgi:enoyl-CoA hydratase
MALRREAASFHKHQNAASEFDCSRKIAAMLLASKTYTASELFAIGAIHRMGNLDVAKEWANEISQLAPLTIAGHKIALESSAGEPGVDALVAQARERAIASDDAREGREAFLQKRPPRFTGN